MSFLKNLITKKISAAGPTKMLRTISNTVNNDSIIVKNLKTTNIDLPTKGSMLHLYYKIEFITSKDGKTLTNINMFEKFQKSWVLQFVSSEYLLIRKVIRFYLERIGKHGKVIKAIKICGLLGVSENAEDELKKRDNPEEKIIKKAPYDVRYSCLILVKIFIKLLIYRFMNTLFISIRLVIGVLIQVYLKVKDINRILFLGLVISALFNIFLSGKSVASYWSVRRAENIFEDFMQGAHKGLSLIHI